jgi:hypothetical protein
MKLLAWLAIISLPLYGALSEFKKKVETDIKVIEHPEQALEDAITAEVVKVVKEQIESIAREEARKVIAEITPSFLRK